MPHSAGIRPRPVLRKVGDEWRETGEVVPDCFEIVCADCGDDGGPIEEQTPEVRKLRGPYQTHDDAWYKAIGHVAPEA